MPCQCVCVCVCVCFWEGKTTDMIDMVGMALHPKRGFKSLRHGWVPTAETQCHSRQKGPIA